MRKVRTELPDLVGKLLADADLDDDDLALVHDAAVAQVRAIQVEKGWRELAHVHDVPHVSVVKTDRDGAENVDASGVRCCDCGRGLVSDVGIERLLVCPRLHGRRPREMRPVPDGAVECGQDRDGLPIKG